MLYLATQFLWFLVAAFVVGFSMGWITRDGSKRHSGSGALLAAALLWGAGAALGWSQWLNGQAALWLESALLFLAVYVVGCGLGALARGQDSARER